MGFRPIKFKGFTGRNILLSEIKRYSMYDVMFFRTNVKIHSERMEWIAEELLPYLSTSTSINQEKLRLLCRVHDDPEIITGDHQLGRKMYTLSEEELKKIKQSEEKAMNVLASVWPKEIEGYDYLELLKESEKKETLESQVMKLIDRLDAFGESLHELYSGNTCFLRHPELPDGVNPVQVYIQVLSETTSRYPLLKSIFDGRHPFLSTPKILNQEEIVSKGRLPSAHSIREKTGYLHYDIWKEITLKYGKKSDILRLTNRIE